MCMNAIEQNIWYYETAFNCLNCYIRLYEMRWLWWHLRPNETIWRYRDWSSPEPLLTNILLSLQKHIPMTYQKFKHYFLHLELLFSICSGLNMLMLIAASLQNFHQEVFYARIWLHYIKHFSHYYYWLFVIQIHWLFVDTHHKFLVINQWVSLTNFQ